MSDLAILGGPSLSPDGIGPSWPIHDEDERGQLAEVLASDVWGATGMGPKIAQLNREWAAYCGTKRSVALANGTMTMELALRALGIGPGMEVIVPAWTFIATAVVISQVGATPVFVDVDPRNLCLDPEAVEEAVSDLTRAIVPVHFGGHPCDMDAITQIAIRYGLVMVEDAAQAHGARWRGRHVGGFGDCGSYSFQQSKNLQCGEGGSVVTDDDDLADRLHFSLSKFGRGVGEDYEPFVHHELAGNATMTEFQAAVVLVQLGRLDEQTNRRNRAAELLRARLGQIEGIEPLPVDQRVDRHGCHLFSFRYSPAAFSDLQRDEFVKALSAEGVPCMTLYPRPLFEEPMYDLKTMRIRDTDLPIRVTPCPETHRAAQEIVAIPHTALLGTEAELDLIDTAVRKVQRGALSLMAARR